MMKWIVVSLSVVVPSSSSSSTGFAGEARTVAEAARRPRNTALESLMFGGGGASERVSFERLKERAMEEDDSSQERK